MAAKVVGPNDGKAGSWESDFMIDGDEACGGFSLVEHPMSARVPVQSHALTGVGN